MFELLNNLKPDCCANEFTIIYRFNKQQVLSGALKHFITDVKLYDTIADACNLTNAHTWVNIAVLIGLNNAESRKTGIICHECENGHCVISLIVDGYGNTKFLNDINIEIR